MSKLAFRAQTVDIAYLPLRQGFFDKNVLMIAQRDFRLGNSLLEGMTASPQGLRGVLFSVHNNWVKQNAGISERPAL